jgi:hypothetical protein
LRPRGGLRGLMMVCSALMADQEGHGAERRHLRVEVALKVRFGSWEHMEHMVRASTLNLSRGGMFICTGRVPPKGQRVVVELPAASGPVRILGVIRHVRSMDGHPFGIGIEFDELDPAALAAVDDMMQKIAGMEVP